MAFGMGGGALGGLFGSKQKKYQPPANMGTPTPIAPPTAAPADNTVTIQQITDLLSSFQNNQTALAQQAGQQQVAAMGPIFPSTPSASAFMPSVNRSIGMPGIQQYGAMFGAGTGSPTVDPYYGSNPFAHHLGGFGDDGANGINAAFNPLGDGGQQQTQQAGGGIPPMVGNVY